MESAGGSSTVDRLANISTTGALLKETYSRLIDDCVHGYCFLDWCCKTRGVSNTGALARLLPSIYSLTLRLPIDVSVSQRDCSVNKGDRRWQSQHRPSR